MSYQQRDCSKYYSKGIVNARIVGTEVFRKKFLKEQMIQKIKEEY